MSGVSQLEAGCVLVEQLGAALQRRRTPMPFASYRIARQPLMAFCGGAGALEPLAGVLGEPLRAFGARLMVIWASGTHCCPG